MIPRPWEFSQGESIGDIFKGGKCNAIPSLNSHRPQQTPGCTSREPGPRLGDCVQ